MRKKDIRVSINKPIASMAFFFIAIVIMTPFFVPVVVLGQEVVSETTGKETTKVLEKATAEETAVAIPVPQIAARIVEARSLLLDMKAKVAPRKEIDSISKLLPEKAGHISRLFRETKAILEGTPSLGTLQTQQQSWQRIQTEMIAWLEITTRQATLLREKIDYLSTMSTVWSKTREAAKHAKAPQRVLLQIDDLLRSISTERLLFEAQRKSVLDLQGLIGREAGVSHNALSQIVGAQQVALRGIAEQDGIPIWVVTRWTGLTTVFPERLRKVSSTWLGEMSEYFRDPAMGLPIHIGLFIGLVIVFWTARRRACQWKTGGEYTSSSLMVFERPFAASLLITLGTASGPLSGAPPFVKVIMGILVFVPMIRLIKPAVDKRILPEVYTLWFLVAIDQIRHVLPGEQFSGQLILIIETLVGTIVLIWSLSYGFVRQTFAQGNGLLKATVLRAGAILALIALTVAFVAGITGYLSLSRILTSQVIAGCTMALGLYAVLQILIGIAAFGLRVWPLRRLYMVINNRGLLERKTHQVLVWLAVVTFVFRLLDYTGLLGSSLSFFQGMLSFKLERGSFSISLGDVLVFFLSMLVAYLLSTFLRFVLQEDVYPRVGVQKGLAYATSNLINYVILALGFIVGLGVVGVSYTRVTVLVGALGVGIGFGLQSIVNNFVSGLILLFERPLHVGDIVEIGDLIGEVSRIGIRASTVRTIHGADIIVPNADLVTKQMTNWTHGDMLRRIDLQVGMSYGSDPQEVIRILETVGKTHPDVLPSPAPLAIFTGYGDSSINFEVRVWTDKFDKWPRVRSDLAVAIYDAVHAAGMTFPFPQREVRILNDPDTGSIGGLPTQGA